jgi:hypothetical protein
MKKNCFLMIVLLTVIFTSNQLSAQQKITPADPEYYAMNREDITLEDYHNLLFNYRGFVSPRQYSVTQFTHVSFLPISSEMYEFNLNFYDKGTDKLINDDVPTRWKSWIDDRGSFDPLGSNFRHNAPWVMVTQDETWQPNMAHRKGTFHKEKDKEWVSFSAESWTSVAYNDDEVFIKLKLVNRNSKDLNLTIIPNQLAKDIQVGFKEGDTKAKTIDAFTIGSEVAHARVSSNINTVSDKGFDVSIAPGKSGTYWFSVKFYQPENGAPEIVQIGIKERMEDAENTNREKLAWAYSKLPKFSSTNKQLEKYYYRCMLTMLMSRYENPNYISDVFWAVGMWPYTISWDTSYGSDVIGMLEPESLKGAILLDFEQVQMKKTYVSWNGAFWENLYIQEPFALQVMIEAYLRHTNDYSLFDAKAADATVWEWMQRWVDELQTNYTDDLGLINVGYSTEKIIEIRTDGYNHAVPITNALTIDLLYQMGEWATKMGDKKLSKKYTADADKLNDLVNKHLWNEELGWFDNLYPDGTKGTIWTYHLFDLLDSDHLTDNQVIKLAGHIQEGEFLGKYGFYSISRRDTVHWDLIDSDWGGGGQYAGMPGRISRYLYQRGFAGQGWDILKRHIRYMDHFPYLPQNPFTDKPEQDLSSMPLEISAGAGMEAIIFGTFGVKIEADKLTIKPYNHEDIGEATLKDIPYKGRMFGVELKQKTFSVYEGDKLIATKFYGEKVVLN